MMVGAIIGTIAIVLVVIVVGLFVDRKVPLLAKPEAPTRDKPQTQHRAGEAPATALRVRADQLATLRRSQRCPSCHAAMHPGLDDSVRYDDAELVILHFSCGTCGATRSLYVAEHQP